MATFNHGETSNSSSSSSSFPPPPVFNDPNVLTSAPMTPGNSSDGNTRSYGSETWESVRQEFEITELACSGMENLGMTCYINSLVQMLSHTPSVLSFMLSSGVQFPKSTLTYHLSVLIRDNWKGKGSAYSNMQSLGRVVRFMTKLDESFSLYHQQDVEEVFLKIQEALVEEYKNLHGENSSCPISSLIQGNTTTTIHCKTCAFVRSVEEPFVDLSLDLGEHGDLARLIDGFCEKEDLLGDEAVVCDRCESAQPSTRQTLLTHIPPVLILHLKRFDNAGRKISSLVSVPRELELDRFCQGVGTYALAVIVRHHGNSSSVGHYTAIGQISEGIFCKYDDRKTSIIGSEEIEKEKDGYLLVFTRRNVDSMKPPSIAVAQAGSRRTPLGAARPRSTTQGFAVAECTGNSMQDKEISDDDEQLQMDEQLKIRDTLMDLQMSRTRDKRKRGELEDECGDEDEDYIDKSSSGFGLKRQRKNPQGSIGKKAKDGAANDGRRAEPQRSNERDRETRHTAAGGGRPGTARKAAIELEEEEDATEEFKKKPSVKIYRNLFGGKVRDTSAKARRPTSLASANPFFHTPWSQPMSTRSIYRYPLACDLHVSSTVGRPIYRFNLNPFWDGLDRSMDGQIADSSLKIMEQMTWDLFGEDEGGMGLSMEMIRFLLHIADDGKNQDAREFQPFFRLLSLYLSYRIPSFPASSYLYRLLMERSERFRKLDHEEERRLFVLHAKIKGIKAAAKKSLLESLIASMAGTHAYNMSQGTVREYVKNEPSKQKPRDWGTLGDVRAAYLILGYGLRAGRFKLVDLKNRKSFAAAPVWTTIRNLIEPLPKTGELWPHWQRVCEARDLEPRQLTVLAGSYLERLFQDRGYQLQSLVDEDWDCLWGDFFSVNAATLRISSSTAAALIRYRQEHLSQQTWITTRPDQARVSGGVAVRQSYWTVAEENQLLRGLLAQEFRAGDKQGDMSHGLRVIIPGRGARSIAAHIDYLVSKGDLDERLSELARLAPEDYQESLELDLKELNARSTQLEWLLFKGDMHLEEAEEEEEEGGANNDEAEDQADEDSS